MVSPTDKDLQILCIRVAVVVDGVQGLEVLGYELTAGIGPQSDGEQSEESYSRYK